MVSLCRFAAQLSDIVAQQPSEAQLMMVSWRAAACKTLAAAALVLKRMQLLAAATSSRSSVVTAGVVLVP
jgi:hypothetical protein